MLIELLKGIVRFHYLFFCSFIVAGCVNLPGNGGGQDPNGEPHEDAPVVQLAVSNSSPQLSEEVVLTCSVIDGSTENAIFDFQTDSDRLVIDPVTGMATFIVEQSDIDVGLPVTCTASNAFGASSPSNEQLILPTR